MYCVCVCVRERERERVRARQSPGLQSEAVQWRYMTELVADRRSPITLSLSNARVKSEHLHTIIIIIIILVFDLIWTRRRALVLRLGWQTCTRTHTHESFHRRVSESSVHGRRLDTNAGDGSTQFNSTCSLTLWVVIAANEMAIAQFTSSHSSLSLSFFLSSPFPFSSLLFSNMIFTTTGTAPTKFPRSIGTSARPPPSADPNKTCGMPSLYAQYCCTYFQTEWSLSSPLSIALIAVVVVVSYIHTHAHTHTQSYLFWWFWRRSEICSTHPMYRIQ